MTGATAHDLCVEYLERKDLTAEQRAHARAVLADWRTHPALHARIAPLGERFGIYDADGRLRTSARTLRRAQERAVEHGFRILDTTPCGVLWW